MNTNIEVNCGKKEKNNSHKQNEHPESVNKFFLPNGAKNNCIVQEKRKTEKIKNANENILTNENENILTNENENILTNENENILTNENENILTNENENILTNENENVLTNENENILTNENENVLTNENENINLLTYENKNKNKLNDENRNIKTILTDENRNIKTILIDENINININILNDANIKKSNAENIQFEKAKRCQEKIKAGGVYKGNFVKWDANKIQCEEKNIPFAEKNTAYSELKVEQRKKEIAYYKKKNRLHAQNKKIKADNINRNNCILKFTDYKSVSFINFLKKIKREKIKAADKIINEEYFEKKEEKKQKKKEDNQKGNKKEIINDCNFSCTQNEDYILGDYHRNTEKLSASKNRCVIDKYNASGGKHSKRKCKKAIMNNFEEHNCLGNGRTEQHYVELNSQDEISINYEYFEEESNKVRNISQKEEKKCFPKDSSTENKIKFFFLIFCNGCLVVILGVSNNICGRMRNRVLKNFDSLTASYNAIAYVTIYLILCIVYFKFGSIKKRHWSYIYPCINNFFLKKKKKKESECKSNQIKNRSDKKKEKEDNYLADSNDREVIKGKKNFLKFFYIHKKRIYEPLLVNEGNEQERRYHNSAWSDDENKCRIVNYDKNPCLSQHGSGSKHQRKYEKPIVEKRNSYPSIPCACPQNKGNGKKMYLRENAEENSPHYCNIEKNKNAKEHSPHYCNIEKNKNTKEHSPHCCNIEKNKNAKEHSPHYCNIEKNKNVKEHSPHYCKNKKNKNASKISNSYSISLKKDISDEEDMRYFNEQNIKGILENYKYHEKGEDIISDKKAKRYKIILAIQNKWKCLGAFKYVVLLALLDIISNTLYFVSQLAIPLTILLLLNQLNFIFSIILSFLILKRKYNIHHAISVVIVLIGFFFFYFPFVYKWTITNVTKQVLVSYFINLNFYINLNQNNWDSNLLDNSFYSCNSPLCAAPFSLFASVLFCIFSIFLTSFGGIVREIFFSEYIREREEKGTKRKKEGKVKKNDEKEEKIEEKKKDKDKEDEIEREVNNRIEEDKRSSRSRNALLIFFKKGRKSTPETNSCAGFELRKSKNKLCQIEDVKYASSLDRNEAKGIIEKKKKKDNYMVCKEHNEIMQNNKCIMNIENVCINRKKEYANLDTNKDNSFINKEEDTCNYANNSNSNSSGLKSNIEKESNTKRFLKDTDEGDNDNDRTIHFRNVSPMISKGTKKEVVQIAVEKDCSYKNNLSRKKEYKKGEDKMSVLLLSFNVSLIQILLLPFIIYFQLLFNKNKEVSYYLYITDSLKCFSGYTMENNENCRYSFVVYFLYILVNALFNLSVSSFYSNYSSAECFLILKSSTPITLVVLYFFKFPFISDTDKYFSFYFLISIIIVFIGVGYFFYQTVLLDKKKKIK
ncbi:hypothetical protein MKS88_002923 [Plasmodium brasilianum]|uniref:Uncharacterized protein n=1 Tax=Plasmodium brasilianum TaxID=5824 RepID=A0ACB9Y8Y1_PLABR|nr:hypothetical protein MKS88_002923 [Plasmodium brasilianum]